MVRVPLLRLDPDLPVPHYAHDGDAGADLRARTSVTLAAAGGRALVPTGVAIKLPAGTAGFILPRSGLALDHGVTCLNSPGLIDCGSPEELKVLLVNLDPTNPYTVERGDRIAQLVIQAVETAEFEVVEELPPAVRPPVGWGSTGRA